MFVITDLQRIAVPLIGAATLGAACIAAAALPARASAATAHTTSKADVAVMTGLVGAVRY